MLFYSSGETTVALKTAKDALLSGIIRKARQNVKAQQLASGKAETDGDGETDALLEQPLNQWDIITSYVF